MSATRRSPPMIACSGHSTDHHQVHGIGVAYPGMGGAALRRPALPAPRREAARQHAEAARWRSLNGLSGGIAFRQAASVSIRCQIDAVQ